MCGWQSLLKRFHAVNDFTLIWRSFCDGWINLQLVPDWVDCQHKRQFCKGSGSIVYKGHKIVRKFSTMHDSLALWSIRCSLREKNFQTHAFRWKQGFVSSFCPLHQHSCCTQTTMIVCGPKRNRYLDADLCHVHKWHQWEGDQVEAVHLWCHSSWRWLLWRKLNYANERDLRRKWRWVTNQEKLDKGNDKHGVII